MQYQVVSTAEVDGPISQQCGFVVVEFTEDGGEGRVVSDVIPSHETAQARADLLLIGRQDHVDSYVEEFIAGPRLSERQMRMILKRTGLTETECETVVSEVLQAYAFQCSFEHRQALGQLDADMGGCAA